MFKSNLLYCKVKIKKLPTTFLQIADSLLYSLYTYYFISTSLTSSNHAVPVAETIFSPSVQGSLP